MGNKRRNERDDQKAGKREDAEDVEILLPSAKEAAQPFDWRGVIVDALAQKGKALGEQVVADMHGAACVTGISVGNAAGLTRKLQRKLGGFDFACVCGFRQFGDPHVVSVPGFFLPLGEDATGILAE